MPILSTREIQICTGIIKEYDYRQKAKALKKLEDFQRKKENAAYVSRRDALIPIAEKHTRRVLQMNHGNPNYQFNKIFLAEMNRLAREECI